MNNSKLVDTTRFHIIDIAKKSVVTLTKFDRENNIYEYDVDGDAVYVKKDPRGRLLMNCTCKDCSYYNIKSKNILCRRQIAVYNKLLNNNGIISSDEVEDIELDLP